MRAAAAPPPSTSSLPPLAATASTPSHLRDLFERPCCVPGPKAELVAPPLAGRLSILVVVRPVRCAESCGCYSFPRLPRATHHEPDLCHSLATKLCHWARNARPVVVPSRTCRRYGGTGRPLTTIHLGRETREPPAALVQQVSPTVAVSAPLQQSALRKTLLTPGWCRRRPCFRPPTPPCPLDRASVSIPRLGPGRGPHLVSRHPVCESFRQLHGTAADFPKISAFSWLTNWRSPP